jgi:GNAT superfamily N-acetyltransferase
MRREDLAQVGCVLARAFADDPFYVALISDRTQRMRVLPPYFEHAATDALELDAARVVETGELGVAGAALWAPPAAADGAAAAMPTRTGALEDLFGADAFATYGTVMAHLRTSRKELVSSPHWYLNLVGVDPSAHGLGIGRSLVQPMLQRADREGRITALETFATTNIALYARFGFHVRHSDVEARTGLRWWLLTRPPHEDGNGIRAR